LTGNDHDLKFEYKYDSTAGKGVSIYVFGVFLSFTI